MAAKGDRAGGYSDPLETAPLLKDRPALDHLFSVTYETLRRLAVTVRRDGGSARRDPHQHSC